MITKLLILAIVLALMAVLFRLFLRSPQAGVLCVVATAPLEKISVYAGLTWKPFVVLAPPLVAAMLWRWWRKIDPPPRLGKLEGVLIAILSISVLSAFLAEDPGRSLRMTIQFILLFGIVWGLLQSLRSRESIESALSTLRLAGLCVLLYGLFQFLGWPLGLDTHLLMKIMPENPTIPYMFTIPGAVVMSGRPVVRLSSTFFDWNIFAAFVVLLISLGLSRLAWKTHSKMPIRREILHALLGSSILFFTFSRSSWIGMCIALVILGYGWRQTLNRKSLRISMIVFLLIIGIGFWTAVGPFGYIQKRMAMMFEGDASIYKHTIYAQAALEMFRRSPALGVGLHNFSNYYTHHFDPNDFGATAHSAYLSFFAETGIVGGTAHLVLILFVIGMLWRNLRRLDPSDWRYGWLVGLGAAYMGMLASSFFYFFYNQVYLWIVIAIIAAIDRLPDNIGETPRQGNSK